MRSESLLFVPVCLFFLGGSVMSQAPGGCPTPATGPDVIVGHLGAIGNYGGLNGTAAYAIGTMAMFWLMQRLSTMVYPV